jgi:2-C-methyl-D-erythritol 2,4-cyclodiphosphate synthase/2-C-methyl-D-erythritol 4-phosphate cytidylyltransferase
MTATLSAARFWAIVPAAGRGERFSAGVSSSSAAVAGRKQYAALAGASVIEWSLRALLRDAAIERIVVATAADDDHWPRIAARIASRSAADANKLLHCVGGDTRQRSVLQGLAALRELAAPHDWVLVHDAARPCLSGEDLGRLRAALDGSSGALLAVPVADTLKRAAADGMVSTVERNGLWRALTPQAFRFGELQRALTQAEAAGISATDEAQAMEMSGIVPRLVAGSFENIKITHAHDLRAAQRTLQPGRCAMRVGQGFDVHAFTDGDHVMLGGVRIAHRRGILAHSDGDVVIHALCDALLGAIGQGDIGRHFPDTDPRWRGADSRVFLREVASKVRAAGWQTVNADITVTAQAPRIAAHVPAMIERLALDLGIAPERINVKATTTENLGFIGREEGLAASATVLIEAGDE